MSSSHQNAGSHAELFLDTDTTLCLPKSALVRVIHYLFLAAFYIWAMWQMVSGAAGADAIPTVLRVFVAIVCAAVAKGFVGDALAQWLFTAAQVWGRRWSVSTPFQRILPANEQ